LRALQTLEDQRRWSADERLLLDQVDRVAREVLEPQAGELDRTGTFPWTSVEAFRDLGLNAVFVPEAYGGAGLSYRLYLAIVKRLAEACASSAIIYATVFHAMKPVIDFGDEDQKQRYLPPIADGALAALAITEPEAGSDATGMRTLFTPDGDDVVIDGEKVFITNGDVADYVLLFGKWKGEDDPRKAITALVLERDGPGLSVERLEDKMGHRASSTAALRFDGCRAPRAAVLGGPGQGLKILLASLNKSRPSIAAHALGLARAAFSDAVEHVNARRQSGRRIIDFQATQFLLADHATELALVEAWLDHVARLVDEGSSDFAQEASMAKLRATDLAMRLTTDAVQLLGGYGYCRPARPERLMRDAKITQIWEGTNQIHRQLIGRSLARR
jgi:alkylation response protein AidB-like acyl-CoA dehydrogenase